MFSVFGSWMSSSICTTIIRDGFLKLEFPNTILSEREYKWNEETFYKNQMDQLANYLLLDDYNPHVPITAYSGHVKTDLKWINRGEVIAGSFATEAIKHILSMSSNFDKASDIDIYFKSYEDAMDFARVNQIMFTATANPMCQYGYYSKHKVNLIYGIPYETPEKLISNFDIRMCSIAIDPNEHKIYLVEGAADDINRSAIVYNPVPRAVSINRLIKYTKKGLQIDPHQRLFFAELVRSKLYSSELELKTGY